MRDFYFLDEPLTTHESIWLLAHGYDAGSNPFESASRFVYFSAPRDYEKIIDDVLSVLQGEDHVIAYGYFGTRLSAEQLADMCGFPVERVRSVAKRARRLIKEHSDEIVLGRRMVAGFRKCGEGE